jgi:hypothetical protein
MDVHAIATFLSEHYFTVKDDDNILNTCIVHIVMLNYKLLYYVTIGWRFMKSCFFIGHREADERLLPVLHSTIRRLIEEEGVTEFYVGGYGGFDRIAGAAVKQARKQHPEISLMLVLPYHPAERSTETPEGYDGTYYPEGLEKVPRRYAIVRANKIMVDLSDWLICYVRHGASNSRNLLEYADRRAKKGLIQIENLAEAL